MKNYTNKTYNKKYHTWDYEEEINFNHGWKSISIAKLDYGLSIFKIKVSRKKYYLQIDKNASDCSISFWRYHTNWDKTKYGNCEDYHIGVHVKNNYIVDRDFFNEYDEIEKFWDLYKKFECKDIF